ncbi:MAG: hypothetical protein RLZZ511_1733 [Cyanobacteriota bacterium]|jgi:antitoxin MazE
MGNAIRTRLIKVGNSQGIRIPKILLEQTGIQEDIEISVQGDQLVIRTASDIRAGWDAAFATMATNQDDQLLDQAEPTEWDQTEWEW